MFRTKVIFCVKIRVTSVNFRDKTCKRRRSERHGGCAIRDGQYYNAGVPKACTGSLLHEQVAGPTRRSQCDTISSQAGSHTSSTGNCWP